MPRRNKNKNVQINIKTSGKDWKWKESDWKNHKCGHWCWHHHKGTSGFYCLGFIGALIYYLQNTSGFWNVILAILKALVWPAFVVYKLLGL